MNYGDNHTIFDTILIRQVCFTEGTDTSGAIKTQTQCDIYIGWLFVIVYLHLLTWILLKKFAPWGNKD